MTYFLRLRSPRVIGSIELPVKTLSSAKAIAEAWSKELGGPRREGPRDGSWIGSNWTVEVTNEKGETQWTL